MIDKQQVKLHFSRNASTYNQYASVQIKMKDILTELLFQDSGYLSHVKNILEIGSGTGYLTRALTELFPSASITAVDIAPGMIAEISPAFADAPVEFICGDIEELELEGTYDLVISNATFQWFNNLPATICRLYAALSKNGILCFSTFGRDTFCELARCYELAGQALSLKEPVYAGQAFYSKDELVTLCVDALTNDVHEYPVLLQVRELSEYEYFDSCRDFLRSVKKIGAGNSNSDGTTASPAFIRTAMDLYDDLFMEAEKVRATYHCLYCKLIKC